MAQDTQDYSTITQTQTTSPTITDPMITLQKAHGQMLSMPPELIQEILDASNLSPADIERYREVCRYFRHCIDSRRERMLPQLTEVRTTLASLRKLQSLGPAASIISRVNIDTGFIGSLCCSCGDQWPKEETWTAILEELGPDYVPRAGFDENLHECEYSSHLLSRYFSKSHIQELVIRYSAPRQGHDPSIASINCRISFSVPARRIIQVFKAWQGDGHVFRITQPSKVDVKSSSTIIGCLQDDDHSKSKLDILRDEMRGRGISIDSVVTPTSMLTFAANWEETITPLEQYVKTDEGKILGRLV